MATIQEVIFQWKRALQMEIKHLKTKGGSRYTITDGKCLRRHDKGATYWFLLASDVLLPDDAPIRVEYKNLNIPGSILSVEGFDVVLDLERYIGEEVEEAFLYSEPWELLEALMKRLDEILEDEKRQNRVKRLMTGKSPAKHPKEKIKNPVQEAILRAKYNSVTYMWGPPGTGKTYTLARMIGYHYLKGKKILVLAHSNAAVDVLLVELASYMMKENRWKSGDIVRYGFSVDPRLNEMEDLLSGKLVEKHNPQLQREKRKLESERSRIKSDKRFLQREELARIEKKLNGLRRQLKEKETEYVEQAKVIGVTLSKAAVDSFFDEKNFDLIVVDEASMAYVPQIAYAASLGKKVVVCGDFKQLPPIAMSSSKLVDMWLRRDIFQAAKIVETLNQGEEHPNLLMLRQQRRMHPDISGFTNQFIYENKVFDHETVQRARKPIADKAPFAKEAAVLVDVTKMGAYCLKESSSDSRFNLFSALVSMQLILAGKDSNVQSIGFIAPYKAQARLMTALIQDLMPENLKAEGEKRVVASTVHKFQGSERDMIIFDNVDSYPQLRPGILLTDETSARLINVAVTRAKGKFIHVADRKYFQSRVGKTVRALIDHLYRENHFYTRWEMPDILKHSYHPNLKWFGEGENGTLYHDLKKAEQIVLSAPFPDKIDRSFWQAMLKVKPNAQITVISPTKDGIPIRTYRHIRNNLVMPFIMMDGEILWVGTPIMRNTSFDSSPEPPFMSCRLKSKKVAKLFCSYLNIYASGVPEEEKMERGVAYRPSYPLKKFIATWDQCPVCRSMRRIESSAKGKTILVCNYCGNVGGLTGKLLQQYIDHVDLRCKKCKKVLEVNGNGKNLVILCKKCGDKVDVNSLW